MSHKELIKDMDSCFEIDPITRKIKNTSPSKVSIVQYDHNSERFRFSIQRFIEGHDMATCNRVSVHYLTKAGSAGVYEITDLAISEENEDTVVCSWLLSQNVTRDTGTLAFLLRFSCVLEDGTLEYAWNSGIYSGISIEAGMDNADNLLTLYADVLENWKYELFSTSAEGVENIYTAKSEAMESIESSKNLACDTVEQKGQSVADSLPDDYIKLSDKVKNVSNTLKGTAKSTNGLVSMHDVSPLEHIMPVTVKKKKSSVSMSDIKVKKYGKNILDIANTPMYHCNSNNAIYTWERTETGFKVKIVRAGNFYARQGVYIGTIEELKGKTITISAKFKGLCKNVVTLSCTGIDGTTVQSTEDPGYSREIGYIGGSDVMPTLVKNDTTATTDENVKVSYKVPDTATYDRLAVCFYVAHGNEITEDMIANNTAVTEWSDILIEIGESSPVSTEYVPYQEPVTYTPNEEGTIEGVTSLYPTTTLLTNTSGVIINCEYNRDINKAYDELKQAILSLGDNI